MNTELNVLTVKDRDTSKTTAKYSFISTERIVADLAQTGWNLEKAQYSRDKVYGRHLLTFVHNEQSLLSNGDKIKLHVLNSHNGTTAARFYLGVFRLVCSNGLMVGQATFKTPRIIHIGYNAERVQETVAFIKKQGETLKNTVEFLKSVQMDGPRTARFLAETKKFLAKDFDVNQLVTVRRDEDESNDAWTVFNRVQENVIRGLYRTNQVKQVARYRHGLGIVKSPEIVSTKARAITAIDRNIKVNRVLWDLIVKVAA